MNRIYNPKKIEKLLQKKNNLMKMHEALVKKQKEDYLNTLDESDVQSFTIEDQELMFEDMEMASPNEKNKIAMLKS